jgi:hypothetical protein
LAACNFLSGERTCRFGSAGARPAEDEERSLF